MTDDRPSLPAVSRDAAKKNAQSHFSASQKRDLEARKEIALQQEASAAQIAKLRALRLAKEELARQECVKSGGAAGGSGKKRR